MYKINVILVLMVLMYKRFKTSNPWHQCKVKLFFLRLSHLVLYQIYGEQQSE